MAADTLWTRIKNAYNIFRYGERLPMFTDLGVSYGYRPDQMTFAYNTERSTIGSVFNRIGIDVAAIDIRHVRTDENDRFIEVIKSGLNNCLTLEANIDQTGRDFIQDVVMSLCDEGVVGIVPVDTSVNPTVSGSYDILTMRTGRIIQWYKHHVTLDVYNDQIGDRQDITLPKTVVAIVQNPLYAVMNEPNSTLRRLVDKINLLDAVDAQSGSGKLDLIIQLPYTIRTDLKQEQAELRKQSIIDQLENSRYGIAYTDASEKITQLNRPAENNLMAQVEYLTNMLWGQLGITRAIFEGNPTPEELTNYYNRTLEPILAAVIGNMSRTFITKTGRTQGQTIMAFRDPFKYISPDALPDYVDKMTRNEVMSSNEVRGKMGMKPSDDPKADELRNKNLNQQDQQPAAGAESSYTFEPEEKEGI